MNLSTPKQHKPRESKHTSIRSLAIALVGVALWVGVLLSGGPSVAAAGQASPAPDLLWPTMRGLNFHTGEMTPELRQFIDAEARIPGYMVPLEDNIDEATEFLLVPYPGACIHVPPPPPNQLVHVIMDQGKTAAVRPLWEAVWVRGMVRVAAIQNSYGAVSFFQLTATQIDAYKEPK
jgi:uncharacterized protein